jgi:hypothetical protein
VKGTSVTTLISWVSYDPKLSAAYIASDSRITWDNSGARTWDAGRKIFPSRVFPDILGYAGDVVFPALALSQIIEAIDAGLMFASDATPWERHQVILKTLKDSFEHRHQADGRDFSILHISRSDGETTRTVHAWCIEYDVITTEWTDRILVVPSVTGVIERLGSGANAAKSHQTQWTRTAAYSREIFSSFCDAISSGMDSLSGGAPQLAGFYTMGPAKTFGVAYDGKAFVNGLPVVRPKASAEIEWRDKLFQRIDISTGGLVKGAQVHARPKGV